MYLKGKQYARAKGTGDVSFGNNHHIIINIIIIFSEVDG